MAKSKAYQDSHRAPVVIQKQQAASQVTPAERRRKSSSTRGERVTSLKRGETYQIYVYENGKEKPYTDNKGNNIYRTAEQIAEKMVYNSRIESWESKSQLKEKEKDPTKKIRKYIVRRKK